MADGLVIRITVENHTTGKKIVLNHDFQPGEVITIDIPKRSVTSSISGNILNSISNDTVLGDFYFEVGNNRISAKSLNASEYMFSENATYGSLPEKLWLKKLQEDNNVYWLARKRVNYMRGM